MKLLVLPIVLSSLLIFSTQGFDITFYESAGCDDSWITGDQITAFDLNGTCQDFNGVKAAGVEVRTVPSQCLLFKQGGCGGELDPITEPGRAPIFQQPGCSKVLDTFSASCFHTNIQPPASGKWKQYEKAYKYKT